MTQRRPHAAHWDRDPPHQLHTSSAGMGVHMTTCPKYSGRARRTAGAQCRGVHTMPVPPCGPTERPGGAAPPLLLLPLRHPPRPPPLPRPPLRCIAPQPHAAATAVCSAPTCALAVRLPFAPGTRGCASVARSSGLDAASHKWPRVEGANVPARLCSSYSRRDRRAGIPNMLAAPVDVSTPASLPHAVLLFKTAGQRKKKLMPNPALTEEQSLASRRDAGQ